MGLLAALFLFAALFAYTFWPERKPLIQRANTRLDFLRERRDAVYANLRDLNFEYKAGKYPEEDFAAQREMLEGEAANLVSEIDLLERV